MKFPLNKKSNGKKKTSESADARSESPMDVSLLERIVKLMAANDLNTVDVRDGDKRVILKRGAPVAPMVAQYAPVAASGSSGSSQQTTPPAAPTAPAAADEDAGLVPINSPMVGTFYSSSSPDAKPFVSVGSTVDEDTDVCIIEAMKVFNNIKAECRGKIAKILVNNGETVEFGQTLFFVKP